VRDFGECAWMRVKTGTVIVKTPSCRSHCRAFRGVGSIAATAQQAENVSTAPPIA
jgi:hypothetical protein